MNTIRKKGIILIAVPIFVAYQAKRRLVSSLTTTRDSNATTLLIPHYLDSFSLAIDSENGLIAFCPFFNLLSARFSLIATTYLNAQVTERLTSNLSMGQNSETVWVRHLRDRWLRNKMVHFGITGRSITVINWKERVNYWRGDSWDWFHKEGVTVRNPFKWVWKRSG